MNDVTTTEKPAATKKSVQRYYITHEDDLISRLTGVDTKLVNLDEPLLRRKALIAEAIILLLGRGYTIEEILSGETIPDRSLPAPKGIKSGNGRQKRSIRAAAMAQVRADDLTRAVEWAGLKANKEEIWERAVKWMLGLTEEQRE